ncbi:MAG: hypothetical protein IV094_02815 [Vitreoscilla sp.]|nr:hypothetical protein [Vitreoscilla sp.]
MSGKNRNSGTSPLQPLSKSPLPSLDVKITLADGGLKAVQFLSQTRKGWKAVSYLYPKGELKADKLAE